MALTEWDEKLPHFRRIELIEARRIAAGVSHFTWGWIDSSTQHISTAIVIVK